MVIVDSPKSAKCYHPERPLSNLFFLLVSTLLFCPQRKKPFCRLSPSRQPLCCSRPDDGSGVVKECWLLTDHLSLTTACRLLSPPPRAAVMDRGTSIAQPQRAPPPRLALTQSRSPSCRAFCQSGFRWQLTAWRGREKKRKRQRQVNTAAILFSVYMLSSHGGHLQFTSRFTERITWWMLFFLGFFFISCLLSSSSHAYPWLTFKKIRLLKGFLLV